MISQLNAEKLQERGDAAEEAKEMLA